MTPAAATLALVVLAQAGPATELEAGYGHEALSGGHADWRVAWLEAVRTTPEGGALALGARALDRFGLGDLQVSAAARAPAGAWALTGEASLGAAHALVPAWSAGAGVERLLGPGLVASAGAKLSRWEHPAGGSSVGLGTLLLERYAGALRLAATGYLAAVDGALGGSARLACDLFVRERDRVGVAVAFGRELESTGAGVPLVTPVLGVALGGRAWIARGLAVSWELAVQRQGERYVRAGATLGLRRRL